MIEVEYLPQTHNPKTVIGLFSQRQIEDFFIEKIRALRKREEGVTINIFFETTHGAENYEYELYNNSYLFYQNLLKMEKKDKRWYISNILQFIFKVLEEFYSVLDNKSVWVNFIPVPNLVMNKRILGSYRNFIIDYNRILMKYNIDKKHFKEHDVGVVNTVGNIKYAFEYDPELFFKKLLGANSGTVKWLTNRKMKKDIKNLMNKSIRENTRELATILSIKEELENQQKDIEFMRNQVDIPDFTTENYLVFGAGHNFEKWNDKTIKFTRNKEIDTCKDYGKKEKNPIVRVRDSWVRGNNFGRRKIRIGKRGGRYYIRKGRKIYI